MMDYLSPTKQDRFWYVSAFTPRGPVSTFYRGALHPLHALVVEDLKQTLARAGTIASKILIGPNDITVISVVEMDEEAGKSHFREEQPAEDEV